MLMRVNIRCHICHFFSTCTCVLLMTSKHIQCHRRPSLQFVVSVCMPTQMLSFGRIGWSYNRTCSVPPTVPWRFRNAIFANNQRYRGWLGSRVVSVLDSGLRRRRAWVQIAATTLSGNSLRQTVHTHCASVHQAAKLVAALLRVAGVTAAWRKVMAVYRRVYDSRHLQADCQEPG